MEETPNTPEALSQHFSRRASAARVATHKRQKHNTLPKPLPEIPSAAKVHKLAVAPGTRSPAYLPAPEAPIPANTQKAEMLREQHKHRAGAARLAWRQLARKKEVVLAPIAAEPASS